MSFHLFLPTRYRSSWINTIYSHISYFVYTYSYIFSYIHVSFLNASFVRSTCALLFLHLFWFYTRSPRNWKTFLRVSSRNWRLALVRVMLESLTVLPLQFVIRYVESRSVISFSKFATIKRSYYAWGTYYIIHNITFLHYLTLFFFFFSTIILLSLHFYYQYTFFSIIYVYILSSVFFVIVFFCNLSYNSSIYLL